MELQPAQDIPARMANMIIAELDSLFTNIPDIPEVGVGQERAYWEYRVRRVQRQMFGWARGFPDGDLAVAERRLCHLLMYAQLPPGFYLYNHLQMHYCVVQGEDGRILFAPNTFHARAVAGAEEDFHIALPMMALAVIQANWPYWRQMDMMVQIAAELRLPFIYQAKFVARMLERVNRGYQEALQAKTALQAQGASQSYGTSQHHGASQRHGTSQHCGATHAQGAIQYQGAIQLPIGTPAAVSHQNPQSSSSSSNATRATDSSDDDNSTIINSYDDGGSGGSGAPRNWHQGNATGSNAHRTPSSNNTSASGSRFSQPGRATTYVNSVGFLGGRNSNNGWKSSLGPNVNSSWPTRPPRSCTKPRPSTGKSSK